MDLRAAVTEQIQLAGGQRALIPTGLALELPVGYEGQIRPRSGLAIRHGLTVLNAPGTIDSDYRGEVQVILINLGLEAVTISRGDRIAQLVIAPCCTVQLEETAELADSNRGTGGFGHTGPN
jgi:dUTP pyrophosphatase